MTANESSLKAQPAMVALFVSDVHLQESTAATTAAFLSFLHNDARRTQQLYLLGDLFEYWAGDDDIETPFHRQIIDALRDLSNAGISLFWLAGNRDFLIGEVFAKTIGATRLADGSVVHIAGQSIVLAHGDAQCTDDLGYIAFRQEVRQLDWQRHFLALPLVQRKAIIADMRLKSRDAQREKTTEIMDVNATAINQLFAASGVTQMIHGHTHRPAVHRTQQNGQTLMRYVLPDWDGAGEPPRGGWIGINAIGAIQRFSIDGSLA
jgi:UDP-2,3-diacylglucosamine hydrolase